MCVELACVYFISFVEKKKSLFILYSSFILAWPLLPAAHSCLLEAVRGQARTNCKPCSAFHSPSPVCPWKSPREGTLFCEHTAVTENICSSHRIRRSSNFCKGGCHCSRQSIPSRQDRQWSLPGQLSLQTCQWRMGEGKQNRHLSQLPASTDIIES